MDLAPIRNSETRDQLVPPADKTIGIWKPYEKQLAPLFKALGE